MCLLSLIHFVMQRHEVKFCIFGSLAFYFALNMFY